MKKLWILGAIGVMLCPIAEAVPIPIGSLSGISGVRIYEVSTVVTPYTFAANSSAVLNRLADPLNSSNADIAVGTGEFYDIFYSNFDGTPNVNGAYLTIEALYQGFGAGLNVSEVELLFSGASPLTSNFALSVVSFTAGANAFNAASLANIGDNNTSTTTLMGNGPNRMRITVDFAGLASGGPATPEPATLGLAGAALLGLGGWRRKRRLACKKVL